ncbi:hypothetical protein QTP88_029979, partial [Uroleucon formosanum]
KTLSPGYRRSDGLAEKAVHISKQLLKKCHSEKVDLETALLEYRCTPIVELNASPSELLMSRLLKTKLPILRDKSKHTLLRNNHANLKKAHGKYKEWHDKRNNKKELLELNESEEEGNVESKNIEGSEPQKYKLQESKVVPVTTRSAHFDPKKDIVIQSDASKDELWCCLMKDKLLVAYASRSLSETENRYGQIEKEFLSVVYACSKFRHFIYGRKIVAWTDHKPMVSITNKNVSEIPSIRLQKMRIKLFEYDIELKIYKFFKKMEFLVKTLSPGYRRSDGLAEKAVHISKQLLKKCHSEKVDLETALLEYRCTPIVELNASPSELLMSRLLKTKLPISRDKSKHTLLRNNHANLKKAHGKYKEWHDKRNNKKELLELNESEEEGNVESKNIEGSEPQKYKLQESKVVPVTTRSVKTLSPGYRRSDGLAEKAVHISKQLLKKCHSEKVDLETALLEYRCTPIVELNASPSELLMSRLLKTKLPILRDKSKHTLLRNNHANLKKAHGKYKEWHDKRNNKKELLELNESEEEGNVESKNIEGSEPQKYKLQESKVVPVTTRSVKTLSPGYRRSDGLAEKAVHISKQLLKKCHSEKVDLETALLEYRCTPIVELNASPSELLMSRLLKTKLPILRDKSKHTLLRNNHANLKKAHGKYKEWHDKRNNKKELLELNESEEEGNVESKNIEGSEPQKYKLQESKVVPVTTRS